MRSLWGLSVRQIDVGTHDSASHISPLVTIVWHEASVSMHA